MNEISCIILIFVWMGAYVAGLIYSGPSLQSQKQLPLWSKLIMILMVLALAGLWMVRAFPVITRAGVFIVVGLVLGAVGDLILAHVFPKMRHPEIVSMVVFGVGHIFYILAAFAVRARYRIDTSTIWIAMGLSVVLAVIGWRLLVYNPSGRKSLNAGSLLYAVLLLPTVGAIISIAAESGAHLTLAAGIVLFAISDSLLAQSMIRKREMPYLHLTVWLIYSSGQMLIAWSLDRILVLGNAGILPFV